MTTKQKILMILTHDRTDCLKICMEMLMGGGGIQCFDRVVLLLNGVRGRHLRYIQRLMASHPEIPWDTVTGPRGRSQFIANLQNECVRRYPGAVYIKMDEDVFVPKGWAERMLETYEHFADRQDLALITALIPNNACGLHRLLTVFYPEKLQEFKQRFGAPPSEAAQGPTWQNPYIAEWATRQFIDIEPANAEQRKRLAAGGLSRWHEFCKPFSIGCICFDDAHVRRMGGVLPSRDEPEWCEWIAANRQACVMDQSLIVLHYAFFVQQEWLDRSSLLEDIRAVNLPGTSPWGAPLLRWWRLALQIPGILKRRLGR